MRLTFSILGLIGGLLCCVGDILFDLKGPGNEKRGTSGQIDTNWEKMAYWRFGASILCAFAGDVLVGLGIYEFRDERLDGFHAVVGRKVGTKPDKAVVYFADGGSRRWQLPYKGSMKRYINDTGAELWIPLFPLLPDYSLMDEAEFTVKLHRKMLQHFQPEHIAWLGFSGATLRESMGICALCPPCVTGITAAHAFSASRSYAPEPSLSDMMSVMRSM